jgi:hypothetical protein
MLGPLHKFRDAQHLKELLQKLREKGVKVTPDVKISTSEAFWFRRGLGLVHGSVGYGDTEGVLYFGFGHPFNPLLWYSDSRLLKSIQRALVSCESEMVEVSSITG